MSANSRPEGESAPQRNSAEGCPVSANHRTQHVSAGADGSRDREPTNPARRRFLGTSAAAALCANGIVND